MRLIEIPTVSIFQIERALNLKHVIVRDAIHHHYPGRKFTVQGDKCEYLAFHRGDMQKWLAKFFAEELKWQSTPLKIEGVQFIYRKTENDT